MKPQSISEKLMFTTVKLTTTDHQSSGTGFFFDYSFSEGKVPVLITNKHVVRDNPNESMLFQIHTTNDGETPSGNIVIEYNALWHFHENHDICFAFVGGILEELEEKHNIKVLLSRIDEDLIWSDHKLSELNAIEDLVMVGYPIGLYDEINNYPIFRKGTSASHPAIDFNSTGIGLMDMPCFPGSSGSPVFLLNEGSYSDKKGTLIAGNRIIFIGILFGGPLLTINGRIEIVNIPTRQELFAQTPIMINLGFYVKAHEILKMKPLVENELRARELIK